MFPSPLLFFFLVGLSVVYVLFQLICRPRRLEFQSFGSIDMPKSIKKCWVKTPVPHPKHLLDSFRYTAQ